MKIKSLILVFAIAFVSCKHEIKPEEVSKINGYWEIKKVVLPDGKSKDYTINESIDYFQVKGNSGFRKKVMPQFDGKYIENGHSEQIKIIDSVGKTYLNYRTECCTWKEELIEISDSVLVVKNAQNLEYHYKKAVPFTLK